MIAVLLFTALFVFISVYFFLRAEKLQRSLTLLKRESAKSLKDSQALSKSMSLMANNTGVFVKNRLEALQKNYQDQNILDELTLIKPFINNYSLIFQECLKKKEILHSITKQCLSQQGVDLYTDFHAKIIKKNSKIQQLWKSNNFVGFISLVEALLVKYEGQLKANDVTENAAAEKLG